MRRTIIAVSWLLLTSAAALAQSSPNIPFGYVPTAAQWNSYFAAKQDILGYRPLNKNGDTMLGRLVTAPATGAASFNLTPGSAPIVPRNGDLWATTAGIFGQVNGTAYLLSDHPLFSTVTADATLTAATHSMVMCDATGGPIAITLPSAAPAISGSTFVIKKKDNSVNACTISVAGGGAIDGGTTLTLSTQYKAYTVETGPQQWWVVSAF